MTLKIFSQVVVNIHNIQTAELVQILFTDLITMFVVIPTEMGITVIRDVQARTLIVALRNAAGTVIDQVISVEIVELGLGSKARIFPQGRALVSNHS